MVKEIHTTQKGETTTRRGNGSAPIAMDDFTHVDMSRYKDEVAVKLLPIRPAFKKEAWNDQRQMVDMDHECAQPTRLNIIEWSREIKQELFGKQLNHRLDDAFNEHLLQLMNPGQNRDGTAKQHFGFGIHQPTTKKDVERLLFEKNGVCMNLIEKGDYAPVIAILFQLVYYPFMETSPDDWVKSGIMAHWRSQNYHAHLSKDVQGNKALKVHGVVRIAKKKAANAWHGRMRKNQSTLWGVVLKVKKRNIGDCPVDEIEVDLGEYLHPDVKETVKRRDGYVVRLKRVGDTKLSPQGKFERQMKGAVTFALKNGMSYLAVMEQTRVWTKLELQRLRDEAEREIEVPLRGNTSNSKDVPAPTADSNYETLFKTTPHQEINAGWSSEDDGKGRKVPKSGTTSYNKKVPSQSNDDNHPAQVKQTNGKQSTERNTKDRGNTEGGKGGDVLSDDFLDKFEKSEGVSEKMCGVNIVSFSYM